MSQKEDILEQIVEEYLIHKGYFVQRNIKYKPDPSERDYDSQKDSVHSDIDVLAFNPLEKRHSRVLAVNIKSYQSGFDFRNVIGRIKSNGKINGRNARLSYRELCIPKWSKAFRHAVTRRTGQQEFTHVLAVTLCKGEGKGAWTSNSQFSEALGGNPLKVLELKDMVAEIELNLTTTPAATDIGRTLQLFRAAGLRSKPTTPEPSIGE
ncbi:MAG: hypothetical protein NVV83_14920 [Afipia sp.]|nr:hypothetical protein [Afipia sp.]